MTNHTQRAHLTRLALALCRATDDVPRRLVEEAALEAFDYPDVPDLAPSTVEIDAALSAVYWLENEFREEVAILSLVRMERETGVNLLDLPRAHALTMYGSEFYIVIRNAMGLLAYAWQIKTHGRGGAVMTVKEFQHAVAANHIPPERQPEPTL
ncbi:MAG: hypothetical protein AAB879_02340 [Patescibacteria group bacterium]